MSPDAAVLPGARSVAAALSGVDGGSVVDLAAGGARNLRRRLSAAEVHAVRKALLGLGPGRELAPRDPHDSVVGYVCVGLPPSGRPAAVRASASSAVAVADHVNLTWESPLRGPNDDRLGPRFPVTAGLYVAERVLRAVDGETGVVAGVRDERRPSPFESGFVARGGFAAVSGELVPVAVIAAHLGYRVAAVVVLAQPAAAGSTADRNDGSRTGGYDDGKGL